MVNVRTILYVVVCMPLFFVLGLSMALILNNQYLAGRHLLPGGPDRALGRLDGGHHDVAGLAVLFPGAGHDQPDLGVVNIQGPAYLNRIVWAFVSRRPGQPVVHLSILHGHHPGRPAVDPADLYEAADVDGASWWHN